MQPQPCACLARDVAGQPAAGLRAASLRSQAEIQQRHMHDRRATQAAARRVAADQDFGRSAVAAVAVTTASVHDAVASAAAPSAAAAACLCCRCDHGGRGGCGRLAKGCAAVPGCSPCCQVHEASSGASRAACPASWRQHAMLHCEDGTIRPSAAAGCPSQQQFAGWRCRGAGLKMDACCCAQRGTDAGCRRCHCVSQAPSRQPVNVHKAHVGRGFGAACVLLAWLVSAKPLQAVCSTIECSSSAARGVV